MVVHALTVTYMDYAELHCHSHYSFLDATSSPAELAEEAVKLGLKGLALTDNDALYGVMPFVRECKERELPYCVGAAIAVGNDDTELGGASRQPGDDQIVLLCQNLTGYHNLSQLITRARHARPKGEARTTLDAINQLSAGLICLVSGQGNRAKLVLEGQIGRASAEIETYREVFGGNRLYVELVDHREPGDFNRCRKLYKLANALGLECVATNAVRYARQDKATLYDVLRCIRHKVTLDKSDTIRPQNHQRFLKSPNAMQKLFAEIPDAIRNTCIILDQCQLDLDFTEYRFPDFRPPQGHTNESYLMSLCDEQLTRKFEVVTVEVKERLRDELNLILRLGLAGYFLVVWDIVAFARSRRIPVQGRGSAANSLVAYLLNITPVDPIKHNLFFGRFLNDEKTTIPDIDLDFAASRNSHVADREDVIQYVYEKYGFEYVALACTFITYRVRGALRDVGKVFDIPSRILDRMARLAEGRNVSSAFDKIDELEEFASYASRPIWKHFREHVEAIIGLPRHLSMHPGGMVITSARLSTLVPLEPARMPGRRVCQWDKDMVEDAGLIKVDLLGLGMLAVVRETVDLIADAHGVDIDLDAIPPGDSKVYNMLAVADVLGVFQVESRVQMSTLPRIKPRSIAELAIQIALIRPGPIQGNMVSPYIMRRMNREEVRYPHPRLESILKETLGVILFQEQVLQVVCEIAGYSPGQAENLRRDLNKTRSKKAIDEMQTAFVASAVRNGVSHGDAKEIFGYVAGFAGYGFCKSHALSFAHLVYQAAWLKCYYPDAFLASVINNQPLGFYPTDVLINDAKRRSIRILPVDVNHSEARCTVESKGTVRLSLTCVKGLSSAKARQVETARGAGEFLSIKDFVRRTELDCSTVERLVVAGACDGFNLPRRNLLWQLWILDRWREHNLAIEPEIASPDLPELSAWEELQWERAAQDCSSSAHPMELLRPKLKSYVYPSDKLKILRDGVGVSIAGLAICLQRPPTAKGVAFLVLEDECGLLNVVIMPDVYERYRPVFKLSPFMYVRGLVQRRDGIIHVKARSFAQLDWE